jgi:uncharacterized repeat protein (TIGR01451 family)
VDYNATLANNGGPTMTHALLPGSAAIDATGACPGAVGGVDQRGQPRDANCDTGAYEFSARNLTIVKANNVGGMTSLSTGAWQWSITITNVGYYDVVFSPGEVILTDNLPVTGLSYPPMAYGLAGGTAGTIACAIDVNSDLSCIATSLLTIPQNGRVELIVLVTTSTAGTYDNPRAQGVCAVDPNDIVPESNEADNTCADTVTVTNTPGGGGGGGGGVSARGNVMIDVMVDPREAEIGDSVLWTIKVWNPSSNVSGTVVVNGTFPAGLRPRIETLSTTRGAASFNGQMLTVEGIGSLGPGEEVRITVSTEVVTASANMTARNQTAPVMLCVTGNALGATDTDCLNVPIELPGTGGPSPVGAMLYSLLPILIAAGLVGLGGVALARYRFA